MKLPGRSCSPREGSCRGACSPADGGGTLLSGDEGVSRIRGEAMGRSEEAFPHPSAKGASWGDSRAEPLSACPLATLESHYLHTSVRKPFFNFPFFLHLEYK